MATDTTTGVTPWYEDKTVYATILAFIAPLVASRLGFQLDANEIAGFIATVISFIVMHKWKTGTIVKANIAAGNIVSTQAKTNAAEAASALNK